jgi:hypothetical protein
VEALVRLAEALVLQALRVARPRVEDVGRTASLG